MLSTIESKEGSSVKILWIHWYEIVHWITTTDKDPEFLFQLFFPNMDPELFTAIQILKYFIFAATLFGCCAQPAVRCLKWYVSNSDTSHARWSVLRDSTSTMSFHYCNHHSLRIKSSHEERKGWGAIYYSLCYCMFCGRMMSNTGMEKGFVNVKLITWFL